MYWAVEKRQWTHRIIVFIWLQGDIRKELSMAYPPMLVDWPTKIDKDDAETWPPANVLLSDLVVWKASASKVPQRERNRR